MPIAAGEHHHSPRVRGREKCSGRTRPAGMALTPPGSRRHGHSLSLSFIHPLPIPISLSSYLYPYPYPFSLSLQPHLDPITPEAPSGRDNLPFRHPCEVETIAHDAISS